MTDVTSFTVIYDACVLFPFHLRDILVRLALRDLYRARWTERIQDEMQRAILSKRPDISADKMVLTRTLMNAHVRDCLVTGYETFEHSITLPDPDDRHVLAAAMRCHAQVILTYNLKDFPEDVLAPLGIEAQHPDDFLEHLLNLHQAVVLDVFRERRAALVNPAFSVERLLESFSKMSLPKTVAILREFATFL